MKQLSGFENFKKNFKIFLDNLNNLWDTKVMKNPFGKTVKVENPHMIFQMGNWEWRVLKTYQTPEKETSNPYARWFCAVKSPHTYGDWEYGDVYVSEVLRNATRIK